MLSRLLEETSARPLGLARIVVGVAALIRSFIALFTLLDLSNPEIAKAPNLDGFLQPSETVAWVTFAIWVVAAVLFTLGWRVGFSGSALLASIVVTLAIDQQAYSNHLYLMAWLVLLMIVADAGAGLSVTRSERSVIRWPLYLLMAQATIVYGFSAITKLNDSFLSGEGLALVLNGGIVPFPDVFVVPRLMAPLAALVVVTEVFIAFSLWIPRFRPYAFMLGFTFHAAVVLLMADTADLTVFALEMLALYPLFLETVPIRVSAAGYGGRLWKRLRHLDALRLVVPNTDEPSDGSLTIRQRGRESSGFPALTVILEHLVPTLWVAPYLRLPGISHLGKRWMTSQNVDATDRTRVTTHD